MDEATDAVRLKRRIAAQARRATWGRLVMFGSPLSASGVAAGLVVAFPGSGLAPLVCGVLAALSFAGSAAGGLLFTGRYDTAVFRAAVALGCGLTGVAAFAAMTGLAAVILARR